MGRERKRDAPRLERFAHVRPASFWETKCRARGPRSRDQCTLPAGHPGPHMAHRGILRKVAAVWRVEGDTPTSVAPRGPSRSSSVSPGALPQSTSVRRGRGPGSLLNRLSKLSGSLPHVSLRAEGIFLLVLFLSFLWFVVDWAIRMARGG